jgi:protein-S-isoprenylcysteine O-methyltransferase Ste14
MASASSRPNPTRPTLGDFLIDHRIRLSVVVCCLAVGLGLLLGVRPADISDYRAPRSIAGLVLALCGLGLRSWAAGTLRKGQALTTTGPYRVCRHPLYLGTALLLMGGSLILPALAPGLTLALGIIWITMRREERRLEVKYGDEWRAYVARTPRLIPVRIPTNLRQEWRLAQWLRSREYNAVIATVLAFVGLLLWQTLLGRGGGR